MKDYPTHGKGNRSLLATGHREGMGGGGGGGGRGGGGRTKRAKPMDRAIAATYGAAPAASRSGRATKRPRRKKGPAFELSGGGADDSHRAPAPPPPPLGLSRPPSAGLSLELDGGGSGVLPPIGARVGTPIAVSDLEETNPRERFETGNGGDGGGHGQHSHSHHRPPSPGQRAGADPMDPTAIDPLHLDSAQFETGHLDSATLMEKKMLLPYLDKVRARAADTTLLAYPSPSSHAPHHMQPTTSAITASKSRASHQPSTL